MSLHMYRDKQTALHTLRMWEMGFAPTEAELGALLGFLRNADDPESVSELGEMESLRLQMAMDRMSKMTSTLSNILKKISDTSSGIVQNLK